MWSLVDCILRQVHTLEDLRGSLLSCDLPCLDLNKRVKPSVRVVMVIV